MSCRVTVPCPAVNTIGNKDNSLDPDEKLVCSNTYTIAQADLDKGSLTNVAMADVNGLKSNQVATTIAVGSNNVLALTKTANPPTYDAAGQTITYTYGIKNNASFALGPDQFKITDSSSGAAFNCGSAGTSLDPAATLTCQGTYVITSADAGATSISSTATASGAGAVSQPITLTLAKSGTQPPTGNTGNLQKGSTVQHTVVEGEWLWQIGRCFGTAPKTIIDANPQLTDPDQLSPGTVLSVPNLGSAGAIYGPPCVGTHTVQSGDTWNSIASKYNADPTVLQIANNNTMAVGSVLTVPLNSAGSP